MSCVLSIAVHGRGLYCSVVPADNVDTCMLLTAKISRKSLFLNILLKMLTAATYPLVDILSYYLSVGCVVRGS